MTLRLLSVNVGQLQPIPWAKKQTPTGIFKRPLEGPVNISTAGLESDHQGSVKYHGGPDQAVYIFSQEDYAWWEQELDRELPFGIFGENLTVNSLGESPPRVGDRWRIGTCTLELSAPRIPCSTLAARMQDPGLVKKFAQANKGGAYARVLQTGAVQSSMELTIERPNEVDHPAIAELFALAHQRNKDPDFLRRALTSPLASRFREDVEKWLSRIEART